MAITFAVQGHPTTREAWVALARRAEELGCEALSVADHPGSTAAPFVALAVASEATARLRLATSVVNAGAWTPLALAREAATLDVLSDGRTILGIGAGHRPAEWAMEGRTRPAADERIDALFEVVIAVRRLLAGEVVTERTRHVHLHEAVLRWPSPARGSVPVLIGGNARRLVEAAAAHADIVELTGLGRTLPDGHRHEADWSRRSIDERVDRFRRGRRGREPRLGALVQIVEVTADRVSAAEAQRTALLGLLPDASVPSVEEILSAPFVMLGTEDEIVGQLREQRTRWGIDRYTVRADALEAVGPIIERLRSTPPSA
jgi:probable F420-dependent oxidoreductase